MSVGGIAAFVACSLALHGCGGDQDPIDGGATSSSTTTTTTSTTTTTTTTPPADCKPALGDQSDNSIDSTSVADQLNKEFSNGKGLLTRTVRWCNEHPCEMWELKYSNSFLLMHPYAWSEQDSRYVVYHVGLQYGWPGFIAAPSVYESMVTCSFPRDGNTRHRNNDGPVGSTPLHCGCMGGGSCGQPDNADWCDVEPHSSWCAYKGDQTEAMMEQFKTDGGGDSHRNDNPQYYGYNEVLVDGEKWSDALPHSVLAFVIPRDCAEGTDCYNSFAGWYADWVVKFGPWPIVHFDAENKDTPYSALPQPQSVSLAGFCGVEDCTRSTPDQVDSCEALEELPLATHDECCNTCTVTDGCEGFVHMLGASKCFLKKKCNTTELV